MTAVDGQQSMRILAKTLLEPNHFGRIACDGPLRGWEMEWERMQHGVHILALRERPRYDASQIEALKRQLGGPAAEDLVCRAAEELALRISTLERFHNAGDRSGVQKTAHGLAAIASQIGLNSVSEVAGDVELCATRDGLTADIAQTATLARLVRVAETSLMAIWDLEEEAP